MENHVSLLHVEKGRLWLEVVCVSIVPNTKRFNPILKNVDLMNVILQENTSKKMESAMFVKITPFHLRLTNIEVVLGLNVV